MGNSKSVGVEDLAIQNTLQMTAEERIELLASLIVDKITYDQQNGCQLYDKVLRFNNG